MNAQQIRKAYLDFFANKQHVVIPRASLVPENDPTTLFTGSGMQPLVPYLLGEPHPQGQKLVNSQPCLRAEDMDEVGDNRHTTFFEMLGNWSLGDYYKAEQLPWFFKFLTDEVGLDPNKLYVTAFIGDEEAGVAKDTESADTWQAIFKQKGIIAQAVEVGSEEDGYKKDFLKDQANRIFYYDAKKNWWSRAGVPANMAVGEPGGPDSEVFYDFGTPHNTSYGEFCHPNCDCGRFLEIGNSVFMAYKKTEHGFEPLPKPNVDFGGGLERIAAAKINSPDMFKISLLWPIIEQLETQSGKKYDQHTSSMRVIADHMRAATFLMADGVLPGNNEQSYVVRRLMRRAIRFAFDLGIEQDLAQKVVPVITSLYKDDYPEVAESEQQILEAAVREEKLFRKTLKDGDKLATKLVESKISDALMAQDGDEIRIDIGGRDLFVLYDTKGFPKDLAWETIKDKVFAKQKEIKKEIVITRSPKEIDDTFVKLMSEQRERSRTAGAGVFKGGLADHSEQTVKYHTATHLMYQAMKQVLGSHVVQRGSNITAERLRFDFSHPEKVSREQLDEIEKIVNEKIAQDLPVIWREEKTKDALARGVSGAFGDKYGDAVKVYTIGDPEGDYFSREICGGPHVEHTGVLAEGGKTFKITKEEASSAGVRRVKAALV